MSATPKTELDLWAERFTETLLRPLREVGDMLAREVDATQAEVAELRGMIAELGVRIERLGVLVGEQPSTHSIRADRLAGLRLVQRMSDAPHVRRCLATSPTYGVQCAKPHDHLGEHASVDRVTW